MLVAEYVTQNDYVALDATNEQLAQGFKSTRDIPVGYVYLYLACTGAPGGYLYLEIQEDADGIPSGTAIENGTSLPVLTTSIATATTYAFTFDLDSRPSLSANDQYHIVLKPSTTYTADATNYIEWGCDSVSPHYQRGSGSTFDGTDWAAISLLVNFYFRAQTNERASAYPNLRQVEALTKSLTDSATGRYGASTIPTITEVADFMDDVSATLDGLMTGAGIPTPVSQTSADIIALYANNCTALSCEMTQMSAGFRSDNSDTRAAAFKRMCETLTGDLTNNGKITETIKAIETGGSVSGVEGLSAGTVYDDERTANEDDDSIIQSTFKIGMFRSS